MRTQIKIIACIVLGVSSFFSKVVMAVDTTPPIATYIFNHSLTAKEANIPALNAINPLAKNIFLQDTVYGKNRAVYRFNGNVTDNAGLELESKNLLKPEGAYSVEIIVKFDKVSENNYKNILSLSNRQSDHAFYVAPDNSLYIFPFEHQEFEGVINELKYNEYQHIVLTNEAKAGSDDAALNRLRKAVVYHNGKAIFDSPYDSMNLNKYADINPNQLIHFFVDNIEGGGTGEFASGQVALIRIYNTILSSDEVAQLSQSPFPIDCTSTYSAGGVLTIPCVSASNSAGGFDYYSANLQLNPLASSVQFSLSSIAPLNGLFSANDACMASYQAEGQLAFPCVNTEQEISGSNSFTVDMNLINTSPFTFELGRIEAK